MHVGWGDRSCQYQFQVVELGLQLQVLFLQLVNFIAPGPGRAQLLLQHGLGLD